MNIMEKLKRFLGLEQFSDIRSDTIAPDYDRVALQRVTERVFRNGNPDHRGTPFPLLTLEEFFNGNNFTGSIGCNLAAVPEPGEFLSFCVRSDLRPK